MRPRGNVAVGARRAAVALGLLAVFAGGCRVAPPPGPHAQFDLTVVLAGDGTGRVVSDPVGIDAEVGSLSARFTESTEVTLTATPAAGSAFAGWTGGACDGSSDPTCDLTLGANTTITATFQPAATLTVALDGSGSVVSDPVGIDTGAGTFGAAFAKGTDVRLTATPGTDAAFAGWTGGACDGRTDATCVVTLDADASITATFASDAVAELDVEGLVAVAGAQLTLRLPSPFGEAAAEALRPQTSFRVEVTGDRLRVAWVGDGAVGGWQVRLRFDPPLPGPPTVVEAVAFAEAGGEDLGADALLLSSAPGAPTYTSPLTIDPLDIGSLSLDPAWADRPLGDVDGDGVLDVGDVLKMVAIAGTGSASGGERYHADLTLDDVLDEDDIDLALARLVDPELPMRLHVRPSEVPFVDLDAASGGEAWVLVGNAGRVPFTGPSVEPPPGVSAAEVGGVAGQSLALRLDLPPSARRGWRPGFLRVSDGGDAASVRLGHLVVLVAGQSNATAVGSPLTGWPEVASPSVRVLGNDYRWRNLLEPMDDTTDQLDLVSFDEDVRYSMGTRLGFGLFEATGFASYLVPSTLNGSKVAWWQPGYASGFSLNLFGSTVRRARVSAGLQANPVGGQPFGSEGGPVTALVWYQGESDANLATDRNLYASGTRALVDAFAEEVGAPVIYVQLASDWREQVNVEQHAVAELQRRLETAWGTGLRPEDFHMVVAFDLPRSDQIHLSAFGQRVLAERVALAIREHVLGEDVDGTGPRLNRDRVAWSGNRVWVRTTHDLAADIDEAYFTVFDGPPSGSLDDVTSYGENRIPISDAVRDPTDPTSVRLTLGRAPAATPYVRYMALPGVGPSTRDPSEPGAWQILAPGVVVADDGGLPLPAFGPLAATAR